MKILSGPMRLFPPEKPKFDIAVDLSKRRFMKVGAAAGIGSLVVVTTACPGSAKVGIYVQTISIFLNEVKDILPNQAAFVTKIIKIAGDFDAAYRRGDIDSASNFFNSLNTNLATLLADLGTNLSPQLKLAMAFALAAVKGIAVLLKKEGATVSGIVAAARAKFPEADKAAATIERLADPAGIDALFNAAKLP